MSATSTFIYIGAGVGAVAELACNLLCICLIIRAFANRRARQPQGIPGRGPAIRTNVYDQGIPAGTFQPPKRKTRRSGHGPDIRTDDSVAERRRRARYEETTSLGDSQQSPSDANLSAAPPPSYEEVSGNETNTYPRLTAVDVKSPPSYEMSSMAVRNGTGDREQDDSLEVSNVVESNSATETCDTD